MIEEFSLITPDIVLKVDFDNTINVFENNDKDSMRRYFNSETKGISWYSNGLHHVFMEDGIQIRGFPSVKLDKIIVIYPRNHIQFPAPDNACVYSTEGKLLRSLKVPELISPTANQLKKRSKSDLIKTAYFRNVFWSDDGNGNLVNAITIDFDWEWWETRVFFPDTGEFGGSLESGRR